jgi:hypothetical protein
MRITLGTVCFLTGLLTGFQASAGEAAPAGQKPETLSPAETMLWLGDHLANIKKPSKLRYQFQKSGSLEEGFSDTVELHIVEVHKDGNKDVQVNFFTGGRHQDVPPQQNVSGNPVLGIYLQGDVYEMRRLTEGGWRYFQRRVKFALADNATVESVSIDYQGRKLEGKKITITPYTQDPRRKLFEKFAGKIYEFTLSEHIPGGLYQIHTLVPGQPAKDTASTQPLIEEKLSFVEEAAL